MNNTPYQTPQSDLTITPDIPAEILKKIKGACVAGIISIIITAIFVFASIYGDASSSTGLQFGWTSFIDIAIMIGLVYGVHKRSRICAILLLGFFILNKVIMWSETGELNGSALALLMFWFFIQGVIGTFQYHTFMKNWNDINNNPLELNANNNI